MMNNAEIGKAMVIKLDPVLPEYPTFKEGVRRAPMRELTLNKREIKLAVANALRYVPEELHEQLAPEFLDELLTRGRIYGYRFMPKIRRCNLFILPGGVPNRLTWKKYLKPLTEKLLIGIITLGRMISVAVRT